MADTAAKSKETDLSFGLDPLALARKTAEAMWAGDAASKGLGMEIAEVGPGHATLSMTVAPHMVNGHGILHGGLAFTLADSAFAFACNAYNVVTVAAGCDITFTAPGKLGDRLTAEAREVFRRGRSGVYDITVRNQDGAVIALFRGKSRTLGGPVWTPGPAA